MKEQLTEEGRKELIAYRMERSHEALRTADILIVNDMFNAAINRIYYACFYAVNALLLKNNIDFSTHHGAKTLFGEHFIVTGKIDRAYSAIYGQLFNARNESDYEAFVYFTEAKTKTYYAEAYEFVSVIERLIQEDV